MQWAPITAEVLDRMPNLRIISRVGIGYDMIDVEANNNGEEGIDFLRPQTLPDGSICTLYDTPGEAGRDLALYLLQRVVGV